MKNKTRILSFLLCLVLLFSTLPVCLQAEDTDTGYANFIKRNEFTASTFEDVSTDAWYYENVRAVYQLGLMVGNGPATFNPGGNVTLSEIITIAARLHSVYTKGTDAFAAATPWYQSYVDYALENGIIEAVYTDYTAIARRSQFAQIFSAALPVSVFAPINHVSDGAIPDVDTDASYADAVYMLYRAGILVGSDAQGTFAPDSLVTRGEMAAISTRMTDPTLRRSIHLESDSTEDTEDTEDTESTSGNRLLYFEDFESYDTEGDSYRTLETLGWTEDSKANGAYKDSTAHYGIVDFAGSRRLSVINYLYNANDSYAIVVPASLLGKYHEESYTYQYDVCYGNGSSVKKYLALVSEYNGGFYHSFHMRSVGTANNQYHSNNDWTTLDGGQAALTDENAIVTTLLGVSYDAKKTPFKNIDFSIRYVVDWEAGNSVYIRINDKGYPGSDVWTLVSRGEPGTGFSPETGGAALALKSTAIDGYIDNIIVWEGTGPEPEDKTAPLFTSKTEGCSGHRYVGKGTCTDPRGCVYCGETSGSNAGHTYVSCANGTDERCTTCDALRSAEEAGWLFPTLPVYPDGKSSNRLYYAGHGAENTELTEDAETLMLPISGTSAESFKAYCASLALYDYEQVYSREADGNLYAQFKAEDGFIYTYYTASVGEVRIIFDPYTEAAPADFGYTYEKKADDTTVIYQYGLPINSLGVNGIKNPGTGERMINYGMMYIIKLADNSVFVIDGGGYQQFDEAQTDGLMTFLRSITGIPRGEQIRISGWYMTHGHQDHMAGMCLFLEKYHDQVSIERVLYNFPSVNSPTTIFAEAGLSPYKKLLGYIDSYVKEDGFSYAKVHTGQQLSFADMTMTVLYTHEDLVSATAGMSEVAGDFNNSSTVVMLEIDGKKLMILGDIHQAAMHELIRMNSPETLRCDIIQPAHHVLNDVTPLYHITQAPVVLVPQSPGGSVRTNERQKIMEALRTYVKDDVMVIFASEETAGIQVVNGEIVQVYTEPVHGGEYGDWSW